MIYPRKKRGKEVSSFKVVIQEQEAWKKKEVLAIFWFWTKYNSLPEANLNEDYIAY